MRHAFDTNVWLYAQTHDSFARELDQRRFHPLGISAVVAGELIRRARSADAQRLAERICRRLEHATLVPAWSDWTRANELLRRVREGRRYDPTGLARLQNDALIAVSCMRVGWTVVTTDRSDFECLAEAIGSPGLRIAYLQAPSQTRK